MFEFARDGVIGPDEKTFSSFSLAGKKGSIDNSTLSINVGLPVGTDVSSLVPYFSIRGDHVEVVAGTELASGSTAFDFSGAIIFTVYAKNGTFQDYEVIVTLVSVPVTGVVLSDAAITIDHNSSYNLVATVYPVNATNQTITWSSSDDAVATVSGGTVNGMSPGTATITVTTIDGGFTDTCTVEVVKVLQYIYGTPSSASLTIGGSTDITIAGYFSDDSIEPIATDLTFTVDNSGGTTISCTVSGSTLTINAGATNGDGIIEVTHTRSGSPYSCTISVQVL